MAEIIKVYRQYLPKMMFVGKCYGEADREDGTFGNKWCEWFEKDLFAPLKQERNDLFEDSDALYGLCYCKRDEPFQYWIGLFLPCTASVPEGYESLVVDACEIGVCWVQGKEPEIYFTDCTETLEKHGMEWKADASGAKWCFERYVTPRFTAPDENGDVILDQCFPVS